MSLRDEVHELLGSIERYNPNNLDTLIEYIKETMEEDKYDLDVYLAVLKLYQFNPSRFDLQTAVAILSKTLMGMPDNDFTLALCLVAPSYHETPEVKRVVYLAQLLETCRFTEFWTYLSENPEVVNVKLLMHDDNDVPSHVPATLNGFQERARDYAAHVVTVTYQTVDTSIVREVLGNVEDAELKEVMEAWGWELRDKKQKLYVGKKDDTVRSKDIVESIEFESLVSLMAATQSR